MTHGAGTQALPGSLFLVSLEQYGTWQLQWDPNVPRLLSSHHALHGPPADVRPAQPAAATTFCSGHEKPSLGKVPFLEQRCPQEAGPHLPLLTPSSSSPVAGVLHEAGETQLPQNDHRRKGEILILMLKAKWILRRYALPGSGSILPWLGTSSIQHSTESTARSVTVWADAELPPVPRVWTPSAPGHFARPARTRSHQDFSAETAGRGKARENFYPPPGQGEIVYLPWKGELPAQLHSEAPSGLAQHSESLAVTRQPPARDVHPDPTRRNVRG